MRDHRIALAGPATREKARGGYEALASTGTFTRGYSVSGPYREEAPMTRAQVEALVVDRVAETSRDARFFRRMCQHQGIALCAAVLTTTDNASEWWLVLIVVSAAPPITYALERAAVAVWRRVRRGD